MSLNSKLYNCHPEVTEQGFQFLKKVPSAYFCVICKNVLTDPVQTSCGCRYCRSCIVEHLSFSSYCCNDSEDCRNELLELETNIRTDAAASRFIKALKVKCTTKDCEYITTLENINSHRNECLFVIVECDKCSKKFTRNYLLTHKKIECEKRKEICQFCGISFPLEILALIHNNIHHRDLCVKYLSLCPYKCGMKEEISLVEHRKICFSKPFLCPYIEVGCDYLFFTVDLNKHMERNLINHFSCLIDRLYLMESCLGELQSQAHRETDSLKMLITFDFDKVYSRHLSQLQILSETKNQSVKCTLDDTVFKNGNYIWHIEEFSVLKEEAKAGRIASICSDPFYTGEFGYKLCMKIYPNGDGLGKQTHLSVFFTIMRGEYDPILVWPFRNKVTLSILDQISKKNHYSESFQPDIKLICFHKPTADFNVASGSPKFITFSNLENYIVNNGFFLKISVGN